MAEGLGARPGGIFGLQLEVLSVPERARALRVDLLRAGRSLDDLGSEALSWTDLAAFVAVTQTEHNSALGEIVRGHKMWSIEAQLMAVVADSVAIANWQRAGRKTAPKPKPIPRPWEKPKSQSFGKDPVKVRDFNTWWDSGKKSA